jgi:multimeric flavodoxin WrbA
MKILGLTCGSKMGNSETCLKEALMQAEELGAEVEILRMLDLNITPIMQARMGPPLGGTSAGGPPMTGWSSMEATPSPMPASSGAKDDADYLWDKIMECDGLIVSAPVYSLTPPGYLISIRDRVLSPRGDLAGLLERKAAGGGIDERTLKLRAGGLISVGGATTPHWVSFGLSLLHSCLFAPQVNIVDQIQVMGTGGPGQVVLNDEVIQKARRLGRHVFEGAKKLAGKKWDTSYLNNMEKEFAERLEWQGDEPGICPMCHTNVMMLGNTAEIECAVCGSKGTMKLENGKLSVVFSKKEQMISRLTLEGKRIHQAEIRDVGKNFMPQRRNTRQITKISVL